MTDKWKVKGYLTCSIGGESLGNALAEWLKFKNTIIPKMNEAGNQTGDGILEILNLETVSLLPEIKSLEEKGSREQLEIEELIYCVGKDVCSKEEILKRLNRLKGITKIAPEYHKLNVKSF